MINKTLSPKQRTTHTYVIGQPGTGKSRAMESWIMQDILNGHGVGVIDPHGDLFNNLLARLTKYPKMWNRIVIVDPLDKNWLVSINPLQQVRGVPPERIATFMTDVMMKIWQLDIINAPRMLWLVTNTFMALTLAELPLSDILIFLGDPAYRQNVLAKIKNDQVLRYFEQELPQDSSAARQWIAPALNKLGALLFDPDVQPMLSGGKMLNLRQVMDAQLVLLVNIPKGLLGEATSSLLGAFLLARIQTTALTRAGSRHRPPFYLYMDEFQNYTTDNVKDILAESRKYGLSITFAHQYLDQLNHNLRSAVLNTAGTFISFRIGVQDARRLSHEIFPNGLERTLPKPKLVLKQRNLWPSLDLDFQEEDQKNTLQHLTGLGQREFWVKLRTEMYPFKRRSLDMPDLPQSRNLRNSIQELRNFAGSTYGQSKHAFFKSNPMHTEKTIPFWSE
jgi:hypothetical protein